MEQPTDKTAGQKQAPPSGAPHYVGKPLDGSQYHDVVEEQVYADKRPTPEEQKPILANAERRSEDQDAAESADKTTDDASKHRQG